MRLRRNLAALFGRLTWSTGLVLLVGLLMSATAEAATFTVDSQTDAIDAAPGDGVCATNALPSEGVRCTLRAAIIEANALAGADIITLPAGTYSLGLTGQSENGGLTGDLDITQSVTINGGGRATTIISANANDRVIDIAGTSTIVAISGVTVKSGHCCTPVCCSGSTEDGGGAIRNAGDLTLTDATVSSSSIEYLALGGKGGGIYSTGTSSRLTLLRTEISDNSAVNAGGGVYLDGGTATITESQFFRNGGGLNTGASTGGGGIYATGPMTITDSLIAENRSTFKVSAPFALATSGALTMTRVTVRDNFAGSNGGGISALGTTTTITDSTFLHNTATLGGLTVLVGAPAGKTATLQRVQIATSTGGLSVTGPGTVVVQDSVISANQTGVSIASDGVAQISGTTITKTQNVGIDNKGSLTLTASLVSENAGSAISNQAGSTATLANVTLTGNNSVSVPGAAISNAGTMTVTNATLAGNLSTAAAGQSVINATGGTLSFKNAIVGGAIGAPLCSGVITTLGHNIETGATCGFTGAGDLRQTDPLIANLADNGGLTQTHKLLPGSPAIDAGDNAGCPSADQRGQVRPRDGDGDGSIVCDVGAFEVQPSEVILPCAPRPNVGVQTRRIGPGQIQGTLTVPQTALLPNNTLGSIQITRLDNATITVNGAAATSGQTVSLPVGTTSTQVVVTRVAPGAFTARLSITDGCGAWPTFIGGGAGVP